MQCFYINLKDAVERRVFLENNFAQYKQEGW